MDKMRTAGIIMNDIVDGDDGINVSLWFQGCEGPCGKHCKGCHNPETWDFNGGTVVDNDTVVEEVLKGLDANGIHRNLSILGGEPLHPKNAPDCAYILRKIKERRPDTKVYLWTGYTFDILRYCRNESIYEVLDLVNILIDGPYVEELRDVSLKMRGSKNQRVIELENGWPKKAIC